MAYVLVNVDLRTAGLATAKGGICLMVGCHVDPQNDGLPFLIGKSIYPAIYRMADVSGFTDVRW